MTLGGGDYLIYANGINDAGQIVANSSLGKAYLLTPVTVPVPEADTM